MNTASPILSYTADLDENCGFLAAVRGITGAIILDDTGLPWGQSSCEQPFLDHAPWLVEQMRIASDFAKRTESSPPEQLLLLDGDSFWHCTIIHGKFYYVVAGSRGSFELFKGRIDRCVQMAEQALKERRDNAP